MHMNIQQRQGRIFLTQTTDRDHTNGDQTEKDPSDGDDTDVHVHWSEYLVPKKKIIHKINDENIVSQAESEHRIIIIQTLLSIILSICIIYEIIKVSLITNQKVIYVTYKAPKNDPFCK